MKILAITPYTGSKKLVDMTEAMVREFRECVELAKADVTLVAVNNAAQAALPPGLVDWHAHCDSNIGFGRAVNLAIEREAVQLVREGMESKYTHVLVLNNDLQFPYKDWLAKLLAEVEGHYVLSPCTDRTATDVARNERPMDLTARMAHQVSAFCWLVPMTTIKSIHKRFGFWLFHPEFSNYGSDDVTGAILRRHLHRQPFKVVPRSWVKHLKAQTSKETGDKAGDPEVLRRMGAYFRSKGLR